MANLGKGAMGALGGAATGASLGSIVPGIGTALGAGAGGLLGGLTGLFGDAGSTPASNTQVGSPQQIAGRNQILTQALQGLGQNKVDFAPIAQQARENFSQSTVPSIAERFSQFGGQRSSAFSNALGQAGAGLESSLAGLESSHNLKQQQLLQNLLGIGLGGENIHHPEEPGFGQSLLGGVGDLVKDPKIFELLLNLIGKQNGAQQQGGTQSATGITGQSTLPLQNQNIIGQQLQKAYPQPTLNY